MVKGLRSKSTPPIQRSRSRRSIPALSWVSEPAATPTAAEQEFTTHDPGVPVNPSDRAVGPSPTCPEVPNMHGRQVPPRRHPRGPDAHRTVRDEVCGFGQGPGRVRERYFRPRGRRPWQPYPPVPRLVLEQGRRGQKLVVGDFAEVRLVKKGRRAECGRPPGGITPAPARPSARSARPPVPRPALPRASPSAAHASGGGPVNEQMAATAVDPIGLRQIQNAR